MSDTGFNSVRFECMGETEDDTYSVFLAQSDEGYEMVWYDAMGDPIIEVGISASEWNDAMKLISDCNVRDWDGFDEFDESSVSGFSFEAEDEEGNIIWAQGAGSFPEGYDDFEKGIREVFKGYFED